MTLTQAANTFRNVIKFGWTIIFLPIVVLIIYRVITPSGPAPGETPTQPTFNAAFGKLPVLTIETTDLLQSNATFELDLINAQLPENPGVTTVYPIISAPYGFLSQDRARELGTSLNFDEEPEIIDNTIMEWSDRLRLLRMNITNLHFTYTYNYRLDPSVFGLNVFSSEELAVNEAIGILGNIGIYGGNLAPNLQNGNQLSQQLRYAGTQIEQSTTLFNTGAIRVDFFRPAIGEVPVVSPNYYQSLINITISSKSNQPNIDYYPKILELNYTYWKHDSTKGATYPTIGPEQAYSLFQQQPTNYVVYLGDEDNPLITYEEPVQEYSIREVEFGFYNSPIPIQYLQPVWVLKGRTRLEGGQRAEFVAYVPAIRSDWIQ